MDFECACCIPLAIRHTGQNVPVINNTVFTDSKECCTCDMVVIQSTPSSLETFMYKSQLTKAMIATEDHYQWVHQVVIMKYWTYCLII